MAATGPAPHPSVETHPAQSPPMRERPATVVAACALTVLRRAATVVLVAAAGWCGTCVAGPSSAVVTIRSALVAAPAMEQATTDRAATAVALPDDWSATRPRYEGSVRYRARFDVPAGGATDEPIALYLERACGSTQIRLNDRLIAGAAAVPRGAGTYCRQPQLVTLPEALLRPTGNVLDVDLSGLALQHVASREFAAGLSVLRVGPQALLEGEYEQRQFWNVTWIQAAGIMLAVLGCLMLVLSWQNPNEVYFGYFGALGIGWALLTIRLWLRNMPWPHAATDYAFCIGLATLVWLAVQFLLSYAGLRSRAIERALVIQWLLMPVTLVLGGEARLFVVANVWYLLFSAEVLAMAVLYLRVTWRERRHNFWFMAGVLGVAGALILVELAAQHRLLGPFPYAPLPIVLPVLFALVSFRLLLMFAGALRASDLARAALARRVRELTTEFEGNFWQLAELRVEQVTEKERKRIAADLHDDLGAKLLTIVHTSDNERITALAREALEDMRLSVKGLIGKPMRLADALADWRAETVARLGQAGIEVEWESPTEETEHLLPSRGFVQTTRIVRESVSNIIKHSGATRCSVRCRVSDGYFAMTIQDNGQGIPMELDGKLDRGLGMSNMKRRAKQMRGQCLVQSGPGYGTVIALTVPL